MATIKEITAQFKNQVTDIEVWQFTKEDCFTKNSECAREICADSEDMEIHSYDIFSHEQYNDTFNVTYMAEDDKVLVIWLDYDAENRFQVIFHTDTYCEHADEGFPTAQDAIDFINMNLTDKCTSHFYDYAGGCVQAYDTKKGEEVFFKEIPEAHTGKPERCAFYHKHDALSHAEYLLPKGGRIEESSADCWTLPCPRELDSWSGEIGAYRVYDAWNNEAAIVGYWD